ncbi:MAG: T9SS type A sorting domain-containing protein [Opitutaceae bacterium]|nr:T9SS type A sorting domain-containing protein [Cytophagales bacterium]
MRKTLYFCLLGCLSAFTATNSQAQDLMISTLTLHENVVAPSGQIQPFCKVSNIGNKFAGDSKLGFYISTDSILSANDHLAGEIFTPKLDKGMSDTSYSSLSIGNYSPGYYYLIAFADYDNIVKESKEKNNISFAAFTISSPSPDLTIPAFYSYNSSYTAGGIFQGYVSVANSGSADVGYNYVGYYFSEDSIFDVGDSYIGYDYVYGVPANNSTGIYPYFSLPTYLTSGTYYIIANADYTNYISESNEGNNTKIVSFKIEEQINDLTVSSFQFPADSSQSNSGTVAAGASISTFSTLYNAGNAPLYNVNSGYYLSIDSLFDYSDIFLTSSYDGYLNNGATAYNHPSLTIPSQTTTGQYFLLAVADYSNQIVETFENNNVKNLPITVTPSVVDLSVYYLHSSQSSISPNNYINVDGYEFNSGTSTAGSNTVRYYLSNDSLYSVEDRYLSDSYIYGVPPGSFSNFAQNLYISDSVAYGNYYVLAVADIYNEVTELYENNNVGFTPLKVAEPFIDLTIAVSSDTLSGTSSSYVNFSAIETNKGTVYSGSHYNGYFLSKDAVYDTTDRNLYSEYIWSTAPGSTYQSYPNVYIPGDVQAGNYYLISVADYPNWVSENNENNNTAVSGLTIKTPEIDLSPSFYSSDSVVLNQGGTFYPTVIESNYGSSVSGSHSIEFYLSNDATYDSTDIYLTNQYVGEIAGYNSTYVYPSITLPSNVVAGNYYLLAVADKYNQVYETNEANNIAAVKTIVQPSTLDLSIYNLTAYSQTVSPGSYFQFSLYDFNNGSSYAPNHYVGYYISKDSILDAWDTNIGYDQVYEIYPGSYSYLSPYVYMPYLQTGDYYLIAATDFNGMVAEYDETNNYQFTKIRVQENGVDLTPTALSASDLNPSAGSFLYVNSTESNIGNTEATSHYVGYYLSTDSVYSANDRYLQASYLAGLSGGNSVEIDPAIYLSSNITDGVYYLIAVADYGSGVYELNEYNNTRALRIVIGNPVISNDADLLTTYLNSDSAIFTGSSFKAYFKEANLGSGDAGANYLGFYLSKDTSYNSSDIYLGTYYINSLLSGSSFYDAVSLNIPNYVSKGYYYLIAASDDGDHVAESIEYNNIASLKIYVQGSVVTNLEDGLENNPSHKIYPNPSSGSISFNTLSNVNEVQVCDLNSKILAKYSVTSISDNKLDLDLAAGIYLVKTIIDGKATSTQKLVITK